MPVNVRVNVKQYLQFQQYDLLMCGNTFQTQNSIIYKSCRMNQLLFYPYKINQLKQF